MRILYIIVSRMKTAENIDHECRKTQKSIKNEMKNENFIKNDK